MFHLHRKQSASAAEREHLDPVVFFQRNGLSADARDYLVIHHHGHLFRNCAYLLKQGEDGAYTLMLVQFAVYDQFHSCFLGAKLSDALLLQFCALFRSEAQS